MNIQWFPGHMAKAKKILAENLKLVDVIIEMVDARVPISSKNPDFDALVGIKSRVIVLNKIDLADDRKSAEWEQWFRNQGRTCVSISSISGNGINKLKSQLMELMKEKIAFYKQKGRISRPIRLMIIGIPNVGKSSFINKIAGRACTAVSDRPGVTRGKQWIRLNKDFELLDTPGVLWPKFSTKEIGLRLACIGSIKDQLLDEVEVCVWLLEELKNNYLGQISARYKLKETMNKSGYDLLEEAARNRGCIMAKGEIDFQRISSIILDEFRGAKIGKITLEKVEYQSITEKNE